ncbi:phosphoribosylglycinamide formyltransferase [Brassicibacter mesophilus]|uniref:phosphoribosylglycinamide formyltransferase n=1 Tax=Brassicibacter mesophilus TaxID=745119 RepID=UPI003D21146D
MSQVKIGVLVSGGGTNLQALIDNIDNGNIRGEITVVIANRKNAYGLERAKNKGIPSVYIDRKKFENDIDYDREIIRILDEHNVELVVLAGYLKILSEELINKFRNRIINIHPSLIPSFCGKGFYGEKVHKAVLEYGVKITGATVHFVDYETDSGPIILQYTAVVNDNDTVESLQKRVLDIEHKALTEAVKLFCEGRLNVEGRNVLINRFS